MDIWFVVVGLLFVFMAVAGSVLERLPVSASMLYLAVGFGLGPAGAGLVRLDPFADAALLERITEAAVIVSLFTAGLKLRVPLRHELWGPPLRLASAAMTLTVGLVAVAGVVGLGLPIGAAILLGAILAPTDPVLASGVQLAHPADRDRLRFALTGEAALNDGSAFPFVMLGLGLLGLHGLGAGAWRWLAADLLWAAAGGLAIGWLLGTLVGRLVLYLRQQYKEAVGLDEFLALGLVALSYGTALAARAYGFLAVFAAGLALRHMERWATGEEPPDAVADTAELAATEEAATRPETAPLYLTQAVLGFNEQLERIGEATVVLLLGGMLSSVPFAPEAFWFAPLLLLGIRPFSVALGLAGSRTAPLQRRFIAWFGIRGIGSVYYLAYAIGHGLPAPLARTLASLTLAVVTVSIVAHGISVTPLMRRYEAGVERR